MRDLFLLASEVQSFRQFPGSPFFFIGGIALQRWGEPRLTTDIGLTILMGFGPETQYIEDLCSAFAGRFPDAADFARQSRSLLLQSERGIPIDITKVAESVNHKQFPHTEGVALGNPPVASPLTILQGSDLTPRDP